MKRLPILAAKAPNYAYWVAYAAAAALTIGSVAFLLAWHAGMLPANGISEELASLRSHAILAMAMAGLSLWLQLIPPSDKGVRPRQSVILLARLLAGAVMALGLLSLLRLTLDLDAMLAPLLAAFGINAFAWADDAMSLLSAICFLLTGASLLLLDTRVVRHHYPAETLAILAGAIMCIPLVGYLSGASPLFDFTSVPTVSRQAPVPFLILVTGILFARPTHPLMSVFISDAPGGRILRRVMPLALVLLLIPYLVVRWGARQGYVDSSMISPLVILVGGGSLLILFWRAAMMLNQEYGGRVKGEAALAKTNDLIRIVSDFTTDVIYVKDRKGRLIFANPAALKLLDRTLETALGRPSQELYADPSIAAAVDDNNRAVLESARPQSLELTMDVDGAPRTFFGTTAPWFGERGEIRGTVGIASDITDRKRTEDALRAHEHQLEALVEERTAEVRELIGHLQSLREEEKRAIARELHDDLGSSLTALNMHLAILFQQLPPETPMGDRIEQIKSLLSSVTATTRRIQNGLRPDKLDIFGIKTAITDQATDFQTYTGIPCNASLPDDDVKYSTEIEISLFRMVQEALNNIAKHARANQVDIVLDDDDEHIYLTIRDDGVGIGSNAPPYNSTHGLRGMRERAAYLGGRIEIQSAEGVGTRIKVILPKPMQAAEPLMNFRASA